MRRGTNENAVYSAHANRHNSFASVVLPVAYRPVGTWLLTHDIARSKRAKTCSLPSTSIKWYKLGPIVFPVHASRTG